MQDVARAGNIGVEAVADDALALPRLLHRFLSAGRARARDLEPLARGDDFHLGRRTRVFALRARPRQTRYSFGALGELRSAERSAPPQFTADKP